MIHAKVLLVDHEQGTYEALTHELARRGYEMHRATTMARAVTLAGAHAYQAAFVSFTLAPEKAVLAALHAEIPDLPVILMHAPEQSQDIPPPLLEVVTHAIGTPLTLGPACLILDRTMELASLRAQVRQHRQFWCLPQVSELESEFAEVGEQVTPGRLEELLIRRLRALIPSLALLGKGTLHHAVLAYVEKLLVTVVIHECRGNQVKAAHILGINRNTLRKKIHEFGLSLSHHTP